MWFTDDEIDCHVGNSPECPPGECKDLWADDDDLRCGWCGKVVGHRVR